MTKLNSSDILGEIAKSEPIVRSPQSDIRRNDQRKIAKEAGASKPSAFESDLRAKLRDKVQCNIGLVPKFVNDEFERLVKESGMSRKEYLYHLLREKGAKIPAYKKMDGRKL